MWVCGYVAMWLCGYGGMCAYGPVYVRGRQWNLAADVQVPPLSGVPWGCLGGALGLPWGCLGIVAEDRYSPASSWHCGLLSCGPPIVPLWPSPKYLRQRGTGTVLLCCVSVKLVVGYDFRLLRCLTAARAWRMGSRAPNLQFRTLPHRTTPQIQHIAVPNVTMIMS